MPYRFSHVPVLSEADSSRNWEELQTLLNAGLGTETLKAEAVTTAKIAKEAVTKEKLAKATVESFMQLLVAGNVKAAFGTAEVEWTVKGKESAVLAIATGLTAITVGFAQRVGSPQVTTTPTSTSGGTLNVAAYFITGELAAGTKLPVFWLAVGT